MSGVVMPCQRADDETERNELETERNQRQSPEAALPLRRVKQLGSLIAVLSGFRTDLFVTNEEWLTKTLAEAPPMTHERWEMLRMHLLRGRARQARAEQGRAGSLASLPA
jgi:hypothetical protein